MVQIYIFYDDEGFHFDPTQNLISHLVAEIQKNEKYTRILSRPKSNQKS